MPIHKLVADQQLISIGMFMNIEPHFKFWLSCIFLWSFGAIAFAQPGTGALREALEKTTSLKAKADISFDLTDRYTTMLKIDSAIYFANKTKEYSQQANYETGIGKYHLGFAAAIYYRKRNEESIENARKAIDIFSKEKEYSLCGRAYIVLGSNQNVTNQITGARNNYWNAVSYFHLSGNNKGLYSVYRWLAYSYFNTPETDSASWYQIKGLAVAEKLQDPEKIYQAASWVGSTFLSLHEPREAIGYFGYGLKNVTSTTDKIGLRSMLNNYATCLIQTQQYTRADSAIQAIESLNAVLKDEYGVALVNQLKGLAAFERTNYSGAVAFLQAAADKMSALEIVNSESKDVVFLLGKALFAAHNYDSAVFYLRTAKSLAKKLDEILGEQDADLLLSKVFQQKGMADSALYYFKEYAVIKDAVLSQQKQKNIIEMTARYEFAKKEDAIKILEKQREANTYLMQLQNQQIERQRLEDEKKSQRLSLVSKQNEINKLDAAQKSLSLDNERKENEQRRSVQRLMEKEVAYQKLLLAKQKQERRIVYAGIVILLVLVASVLYRYLRKKRLENQKEVLDERLRISRELHDEVGATLSGVALFSEIAKQKMEAHHTEDAQTYLAHISSNSKEMVEKMSDIVWSINPDNDSFERIIAKLQRYAFNLCAGKGISLHIDTSEELAGFHPVMQVKRNLYLFMKEAINNAIKYAGATNIVLSVKKLDGNIIASIVDDGKGFDTSGNYGGNGLQNMRARAEGIEGIYKIESVAGKGTLVSMQFRFHPAGGQSITI